MLDVRSVSRRYGDLKAVDDVSFAVGRGEIVGLLGHNGAGKTTIMKMLSGYLEPDAGEIRFNQVSIESDAARLQCELGYLPENLPVYPELSVASYLDYAAELKGLSRGAKRQALRDAIEATELGARLLSPIATLSRGLKQRVGVAQAIIGRPSLLILDEPTNGLDPAQTELMRALIRQISESATIILSTHIMQEVEAVCDRALILRHGRLAVDARLDDLTDTRRIKLLTTASHEQVSGVLKPQPWFQTISQGVSCIERPGASAADELIIELRQEASVDMAISACAIVLVGAGIPILGLQPVTRDLQSLFLDVNAADWQPASETTREIDHVA